MLNIEECDYNNSKIIFKDSNLHYKIYLSPNNHYLKDVIYLFNNNIIQNFTSDVKFITNNDNEIIGYSHKTINTDMNKVCREEYIKFYKSFTKQMRDNHLCYFDISPANLGYVINNNIKIVKIIDIDLFISANILFPQYKKVTVSNINAGWHLNEGIKKYQDIMNELKLYDFELNLYYNKKSDII